MDDNQEVMQELAELGTAVYNPSFPNVIKNVHTATGMDYSGHAGKIVKPKSVDFDTAVKSTVDGNPKKPYKHNFASRRAKKGLAHKTGEIKVGRAQTGFKTL